MNKKTVAGFVLAGIVFAGLGAYFGAKVMEPAPPQADGVAKLLSKSMPDVKGEVQPLAQWQGKPLIVNFWATWCAPCVEEMPELSELQAEIASRNIHILGIGIDSPSNIAQFAAKYKISYPLYTGGIDGSELARQLGNQAGGLPYTVLIDREGKVKKTYLGRLKMEELRRDLAAL